MAIYVDYREANTVVTDAAAINNAIKNILFTQIGTMPGKPDFGSNIHEVLFNQLDHITADLLKNLIREAIAKWESRILITNVTVEEVPEYNKLIASIYYMYRDSGLDINEKLSIALTQ